MKKHEQSRKPKPDQAKRRRGPGRPQIWQTPLLKLKNGQHIPAQNKSEAMSLYVCGYRMKPRLRVRVEKQPDGTYKCFRK